MNFDLCYRGIFENFWCSPKTQQVGEKCKEDYGNQEGEGEQEDCGPGREMATNGGCWIIVTDSRANGAHG